MPATDFSTAGMSEEAQQQIQDSTKHKRLRWIVSSNIQYQSLKNYK